MHWLLEWKKTLKASIHRSTFSLDVDTNIKAVLALQVIEDEIFWTILWFQYPSYEQDFLLVKEIVRCNFEVCQRIGEWDIFRPTKDVVIHVAMRNGKIFFWGNEKMEMKVGMSITWHNFRIESCKIVTYFRCRQWLRGCNIIRTNVYLSWQKRMERLDHDYAITAW